VVKFKRKEKYLSASLVSLVICDLLDGVKGFLFGSLVS
jgi:hypothetical protein